VGLVVKKLRAIWLTLLLCITAPCAIGQRQMLDASKLYPGWVVSFLQVQDGPTKETGEYSLSMFFFPKNIAKQVNKIPNNNVYYVDNYGFNNSAPQFITVFFDKKGDSKYAIVLVKWHISALGADTLAEYYQIIAYRLVAKGHLPKLIKDEKISAELGQGYDGQEDGQEVQFKLKTANDIKKKFDAL
jgi:hypothetical protein